MRSPGRSSVCDCHPHLLTPGESKSSRLIAGRITLAGAQSPPTDCPARPWSRSDARPRADQQRERPARLSGAGRLSVSMLLLGLVLVGWLLAVCHSPSTPAATASVAWTSATWTCQSRSAPPLDERRGGHDPLGVGEGLARGRAGWLGIHGPDLHAGQGPGLVLSTPTGAALLVTSTQRLPEAKTIKNR